MKKKGLCSSCINDKECTFFRKFPVFQCEEFVGYKPKPTKMKKKMKKEKMKFDEELMIWE